MRRIIITNKTHWNGRHLRAFVVRCARDVLDHTFSGKSTPLPIRVTFAYNRQVHGQSSGCAHLGSWRLRVTIPSQSIDKVDLAHTITHEIGHACLRLEHRSMRGKATYQRVGNWRELFSWAERLPLEKKLERKKGRLVGMELAVTQLDHARERIKALGAKQKRLASHIRKWKDRERYYVKRIELLAGENAKKAALRPGGQRDGSP